MIDFLKYLREELKDVNEDLRLQEGLNPDLWILPERKKKILKLIRELKNEELKTKPNKL